jgi:ABC-type branched-subunit amino acid transport system substrate-binding protein
MVARGSLLLSVLVALLGCDSGTSHDLPIPIGVLLSYSGTGAANSTNSERALQLAIEGANAAGGVQGRPLRLVARDTHSDPDTVTTPAGELMSAGASVFIGPDTPELAVPLVTPLDKQVLILPSIATAHSPFRRPPGWFVMGTGTARFACELHEQLQAQQRVKPVVLVDGNGYDTLLAWELTRRYGIPQVVLRAGQPSNINTLQPILSVNADAYVLATLPQPATSLIFAMAAVGSLGDPGRWYLTPGLHTPSFLDTIPKGMLTGARGVAPGTVAGVAGFRERFIARWQDQPLDDAYPFYDAAAVAVLALQRSSVREGTVAPGPGLIKHVLAVTRPGAMPVQWDQLALGLQLLAAGQEIEYQGVTGLIEFDVSGQTSSVNTKWWTIGPTGFEDIPRSGDCSTLR